MQSGPSIIKALTVFVALLLIVCIVTPYVVFRFTTTKTAGQVLTEKRQRAVPQWINGLRGRDVSLRRQAAAALATVEVQSEDAVVALIEALDDEDPEVRAQATVALGSKHQYGEHAVGPLLRKLMDQEMPVRAAAAMALFSLRGLKSHPEAKTVIQPLIELLKHEDSSVRQAAAVCLTEIGPATVPALVEALKDEAVTIHWDVTWALSTLGKTHDDALAEIVRALKHSEARIRAGTAMALGYHDPSPRARAALPVLLDLVSDPVARVREAVARTLGRIRSDPEQTVSGLTAMLSDKDGGVRAAAAQALGCFGKDGVQGLTMLRSLVEDTDSRVRASATVALAKVEPDPNQVIPVLSQCLSDEVYEVRFYAALALSDFGPEGKAAVPVLLELARTKRPEEPSDSLVRAGCIRTLPKFGEAAKAAVPVLLEMLQDKSETSDVLHAVAEALHAMDGEAPNHAQPPPD